MAVLAALAAACGGSRAQSTPASLQGTVHTASGTAAAGVVATISGSNLSARTDDSGNFSIDDAPEGPAAVELKGSGVDASVAVPRLNKDMVVHVRIRIRDDGKGELEDEPEAEIRGPIDAISGADLSIAGLTIHTDAQTVVDGKGASKLDDVKVGMNVEVHAIAQSDGSTLARRIHLED